MSIRTIFGILLLLMVMQLIGMRLQVRAYRNAVSRLHKLGNLGIGSMRGKFGAGHIVIIACDRDGKIVGGEIMEGMTIFSRFRQMSGIAGKTIYDLPEKKRKKFKGHLQALEALEARLASEKKKEVESHDEEN